MTEDNNISNNKRIAKNTMMLYFRMLLTMGVSLYTVRVVLQTLGVADYGIYNVVGGIVTMFSFLSSTMASASQRFFAFELGRKDYVRLKQTFSLTLVIYIGIAIIILLLAETLGLWFLNTQMNISPERMNAANWVYQFAIFSFMMTMFTIPYNAAIIARERMSVYAWVSIIEVVLKLLIVYLLVLFSFDKLKLYAILIFCVTTIVTFIYRTYCKRKFEECSYSFYWEKSLFKDLINYSGWNLFGALSSVSKGQGINIILNVFLGTVVNAARGIAYQVDSIILNLGNNFFTAVRPQIIKLYATNQQTELMNLIFRSTKFSFYLLFFFSLPLLLETDFLLRLWLIEIPNYTIIFTQLIIIDTLLELLMNPIITLAQATGRIKWYQIIVGGMRILNLPLAYLALRLGCTPIDVFYILIANTLVCNILRLVIIKWLTMFDIMEYIKKVVLSIVIVSFFAILVPKILQLYWNEITAIKSLSIIMISLINLLILTLFLGINKNERIILYNMLRNKIIKKGYVKKIYQ